MSKTHVNSAITPSELLAHAISVMEASGSLVRFVLDPRVDARGNASFMLVCEAREGAGEAKSEVDYSARLAWPCSTHKQVVAALYWLLLDVDSQLAASSALAGLGDA